MLLAEDQVVHVAGDNDEMMEAVNAARASIREFFEALKNPQPNRTDFFINASFEDGTRVEHLWLCDLDFESKPATGVVANEPEIGSVSYMERVPFFPDQISDWMYREDGQLVGAFTTRVLLRAKTRPDGLAALRERALTM